MRKRFHSVGALGSGTLYCKFYDRPSTENYTGILTNVYGEYGRSVTFVDSAPCHKSEALGRFLERMDGRIRIYPPYTPEANPMEMQGGGRSERRPRAYCMRAWKRCRSLSMRCGGRKRFQL